MEYIFTIVFSVVLYYCAGAQLAPVAPEFPAAAADDEPYVAEKEVAASAVFSFVEQKPGAVVEASQIIVFNSSDDLLLPNTGLLSEVNSETSVPSNINVGEPWTPYLFARSKSFCA